MPSEFRDDPEFTRVAKARRHSAGGDAPAAAAVEEEQEEEMEFDLF